MRRDNAPALINVVSVFTLATFASCLRLLLGSLLVLRLDEASNDLMIIDLVHFNFIQRSQNLYVFVEDIVFRNGCHCRTVMLLETHYHMADEWAFRRQERSARF